MYRIGVDEYESSEPCNICSHKLIYTNSFIIYHKIKKNYLLGVKKNRDKVVITVLHNS